VERLNQEVYSIRKLDKTKEGSAYSPSPLPNKTNRISTVFPDPPPAGGRSGKRVFVCICVYALAWASFAFVYMHLHEPQLSSNRQFEGTLVQINLTVGRRSYFTQKYGCTRGVSSNQFPCGGFVLIHAPLITLCDSEQLGVYIFQHSFHHSSGGSSISSPLCCCRAGCQRSDVHNSNCCHCQAHVCLHALVRT